MLKLFLSFTISFIVFNIVVHGHGYGHSYGYGLGHDHEHGYGPDRCLRDWEICDLFGYANKCCSGYCRKDHTSPEPRCHPSVRHKCRRNGCKCRDDSNCCSKRCVKNDLKSKKGKCQPPVRTTTPMKLPKTTTTTTTTTTILPVSTTIKVTYPTTTTTTTTTTPSTTIIVTSPTTTIETITPAK